MVSRAGTGRPWAASHSVLSEAGGPTGELIRDSAVVRNLRCVLAAGLRSDETADGRGVGEATLAGRRRVERSGLVRRRREQPPGNSVCAADVL
jgi:hypothetical protein